MQRREQLLAAVLGLTLLGWLGLPMLERQFLAPIEELRGRETSLQGSIDKKFELRKALSARDAELQKWRAVSLPPDPLDAQRLYQEWLINLAQQSGFAQPVKVTLERRTPEGDTFVTIPVKLESKATLQELALFLERFHSVNLLHRLSYLQVNSPASEGDPEMTVILTAEGLSLTSAPPRNRLFAQGELESAVTKDARTISVVNVAAFPQEVPFRVRVGDEFMNVTARDGNTWTVQRGVARTFAGEQSAGATIEHFPLKTVGDSEGTAVAVWSHSLFTKPAPQLTYTPRLASATPPPAIRGQEWKWKLDVAGWNPAFGTPSFELVSAPSNVRLNSRTGELTWRVDEQVALGEASITALVWGTNGRDAGFTPSVKVRVRDPNRPPRIAGPAKLDFFIGRESSVRIEADDPDPQGNRLTYQLEAAAEGMTIDAATGLIRWKPPENLAPQEFQVTVKVTDSDELAASATRQIPVSLQEDSARFTYLTGTIREEGGRHRAMITDRITNQRLTRFEGERLQVADLDLLVKEIGKDFIVVHLADRPYRIEFKQPFAEMTPMPLAAVPAPGAAEISTGSGNAPGATSPTAPTIPPPPPLAEPLESTPATTDTASPDN